MHVLWDLNQGISLANPIAQLQLAQGTGWWCGPYVHGHYHPSEWNRTAYGRTWTSKISLTYLSAISVPLSMMCRSVFPWALIPAHINWTPAIAIMLCNTNFSKTFISHPPDPSPPVSEVHTKPGLIGEKNGGPVIKGHVTWYRAHSKRSWTWCRINGMHIAGRRDLKPASCNWFLMVCVRKRTR